MKKLTFLFLLGLTFTYAQNTINQYKYIIVPKTYEFLKDENKYRLNTMTKLLFNDNNFMAVYDDELPQDLADNICSALRVDLKNDSSMFTTKLNLVLKDCKNNVVYTSEEGKSKIKEFGPAYQEALKDAFTSIKALNYKYEAKAQEKVLVVSNATVKQSERPINAQVEAQIQNEVNVIVTPIKVEASKDVLYAQPVANGFQLVDMSPRVVYIVQNTSVKNVFIIKDKNGILFKGNDGWTAEYYEGDILKQEVLNIKF